MATPTTNSADRVQQTVNRIESDNQHHDVGTSKLHDEVNYLRQQDSQAGKLDNSQFKADLAQVNDKLHADGILPHLEIVSAGNGDAAFRGISEPGKTPSDGQPSLVTKSHGTTFTYDSAGHVQSWSKHGDTWNYSSEDGQYHESMNGKATGKTNSDVVTLNGGGAETVTHPDGSTTLTTAWGGTTSHDANGHLTSVISGKDAKTFVYQGDALVSMTDKPEGKPAETYTLSGGKYYAASDKNHQNPMDISVEPQKNADGSTKLNGQVELTDKNGNITVEDRGGTNFHWDASHRLTSIDYSNGTKASNFSYDSIPGTGAPGNLNDFIIPGKDGQSPLGLPSLKGFTMTGKDGQSHTYASANGDVTIDNGTPVKGTLTADASGVLTVTQTGDGSDAQYKSTKFVGGFEVQSGKFAGQIKTTETVNWSGKENKFGYDAQGNLNSVDAYGNNLHLAGGKWVDASGKPSDLVPTVENGTFSVTQPDGTFNSWGVGGTKIQGIPDTPEAIAKEAKDAQATDSTDSSASAVSATGTKGNSFHPAGNDVPYQGDMTIDLDGQGAPSGGTNQSSTSYADGRLSAFKTNYVALAPGWAQAHGLHLGDVVAAKHDGKVAYAIYGDNYMGNAVHTEGSISLARALNPGNPEDSTLANVQFYALPGSGRELNGSINQTDINRVGSQLFQA